MSVGRGCDAVAAFAGVNDFGRGECWGEEEDERDGAREEEE